MATFALLTLMVVKCPVGICATILRGDIFSWYFVGSGESEGGTGPPRKFPVSWFGFSPHGLESNILARALVQGWGGAMPTRHSWILWGGGGVTLFSKRKFVF